MHIRAREKLMKLRKKLGILACAMLLLGSGGSTLTTEADSTMSVVDNNADDGTFTVTVSKSAAGSKYKKIYLDVWSEVDGKDDLQTLSLSSSKSKWSFNVKAEKHNYDEGTYCLQAYCLNSKGSKVKLAYTTYDVAVNSEMNLSVSLNKDQSKIIATINNARYGKDMLEKIKVRVWSYENGQDDIKTYTLKNKGTGTYTYTIPISKHNYNVGAYRVEAYAYFTEGEPELISSKKVTIKGMSNATVSTKLTNSDLGKWSIYASGITGPATIKKVQIKMWYTSDGPETAKWITAKYKKSTKRYTAYAAAKKFAYKKGSYTMEVYATDARGVCQLVGTINRNITPNLTKSMSYKAEQKSAGYDVTVSGLGCLSKVSGVTFKVWSVNSSVSSATSYEGTLSGSKYVTTIPMDKFTSDGAYNIGAYVTVKGEGTVRVAQNVINVQSMVSGGCSTRYVNNENGSFQMVANPITSVNEVSKVEFIVTPSTNPSLARIYTARKVGNSWLADAGAAQFDCTTGQYVIQVKATDTTGAEQIVDTMSVNVEISTRYANLCKGSVQMRGIDISKYQASPQSDGSYKTTIDWNKVKSDGIDFVMIRIGYRGAENGNIYEDPTFQAHLEGAQNAGINVGVYFFSQAITEAEAEEEVKWIYNKIKEYRIDFPICIDSEAVYTSSGKGGRANSLSKAARTKVTAAFCNAVVSYGYTPLIYASTSWLNNNLDMNTLSKFDVWVAQYGANNGKDTHKVTYTGKYTMWQFTSTATVKGVSGKVDKNNGYYVYSAGDGNGKAYTP